MPELEVKRTNVNSELWKRIPLSQAVDEIAAQTSAVEFNSRLAIVAAFCDGKTIEVGLYAYTLD